MIKLKLISKILCIAFSALTIVVYGKIEPPSVQGQGTATSRTQLFDIISGIFKNDYHESTMEMEESKTPKQRITGSISYILSDSGKCCEPSNPPSTTPKLADHENCSENEECESDRCEETPTCIIACCIPEAGLNNGSRCNSKDQCLSDYCNESNVCSEKRPINSGCQADEDCVSGLVCSEQLCKIGVGETCEDDIECETGLCSEENKCKVKEIVGANCEHNVDCDTDICSNNICKLGVGESCEDDIECETNLCSEENMCKIIFGANCEQNVDCDTGTCSDNICKIGVGETCEDDNECGTNFCTDNKCKIVLSGSCQSSSECETDLCSESICNLYPEEKLEPLVSTISACDMSDGVAVVGVSSVESIFLYEYGELQKEIKPTNIQTLFGANIAIDKYIVALGFCSDGACVEVFDRSGDYVQTIDGCGYGEDVTTAGDLFAYVCEQNNGSLITSIYSIETGELLHTLAVAGWAVAMTEEYIVVETEYRGKLSVYSLENDYELVGEIPGSFQNYDIFDQHVVASTTSSQDRTGAIHSIDGSLVTSLQLKLNLVTNNFIADVSMSSRFVAIGFSYTDGYRGAIHIYDAQTGSFLQSMTSLTPEVNEYYGNDVALSGVYMISRAIDAAYFQSVLIDDDI